MNDDNTPQFAKSTLPPIPTVWSQKKIGTKWVVPFIWLIFFFLTFLSQTPWPSLKSQKTNYNFIIKSEKTTLTNFYETQRQLRSQIWENQSRPAIKRLFLCCNPLGDQTLPLPRTSPSLFSASLFPIYTFSFSSNVSPKKHSRGVLLPYK